jgi:hypothetical protein
MIKPVKVFLAFLLLGPSGAIGLDTGRGLGPVPQSPMMLIQNLWRNAWNELGSVLLIFFGGSVLQAAFAGLVSAWWFSRKDALPFHVPLAAGLLSHLAFMLLYEGRYWYMKIIDYPRFNVSLRDFDNTLLFLVLHVALVFWPWLLLRQSGLIHNDPHRP